jgi:aryl-alcohol dehydrogenase-like predicted oxidoreductase
VKRRTFGKTDLNVSELGIGCARIGGIFQNDASGFVRLLGSARDAGINFFDTADMYSQGESEQLLGRAFGRSRNRVIIASKVGYALPARRMVAARLKPLLRPVIRFFGIRRDRLPSGARGALAQDFSGPYVKRAVEGSLRRLRTDYLDILQLHSPPLDVVEQGEWLVTLEALKREGKIRYYGIACDTVDVAMAALRYPGVSSIQITLNLLDPRAEAELVPKAEQQGVGVIAREILANGLLAKRAEEIDLAKFCSSAEERTLREGQLAARRREAADAGKTLTRMALDYATGVSGVSVALLGVRSTQQLDGLLKEFHGASASAAVA